jgi:iron-sulfur cluster insertion protein
MSKEQSPESVFLRIEVQGGGCSGFQYNYQFDTTPQDGDFIIEKLGAKVVVDTTSLPFIEGSQLDYVETLGSAAFEIKNPNATANCGCGNSFSV